MTRPPILRYVGPVPYVRCFSSVRPDNPRKRAASGVRRKRGGKPASGSAMIEPPWSEKRAAGYLAADPDPRWRNAEAMGDGENRGWHFRHPPTRLSRETGGDDARV